MSNRGVITQALKNKSSESKRYISLTVDIATHIQDLLDAKGWSQKDLAEKMGRQNSEISKWLTGTHNFTLKTLSKIECVLGEEIVFTKNQTFNRFFHFSAHFKGFGESSQRAFSGKKGQADNNHLSITAA